MHKTIEGYPNYIIFSDGRIYSKTSKRFLRPNVSAPYPTVELFNEKNKSKRLSVHRLVANAFIPNPYNLPIVNHKDENKLNYHVSNLEWCTAKYNMNYGNCQRNKVASIDYTNPIFKITAKKAIEYWKRPVMQFTKDGKFLARYESAQDAGRKVKCHGGHISECCAKKRYKTVGGFVWRYEKEE